MARGDLKGDQCIVKKLVAGAAVAKGDLVHYETDQKWDPAITADTGPFAVAIEAATADTDEFLACIYGPVDVEFSGATAAKVGTPLCASTYDTGSVVVATTFGTGLIAGVAWEAEDTSGNEFTMFVGLQTQ